MRALLPPADDPDLPALYAYPTGQPWLRAAMVASLDGAATVDGSSRGLSSPADLRLLVLLRDLSDAVVVGAGTARAERYRALTGTAERRARRTELGRSPVPALVVVTAGLALDPDGPLFAGPPARTLLVTTEAAAAAYGARFAGRAEVVTTPGATVDVRAAVAALHAYGLTRLLCEGGPTLLAAVAAARCLDELCLTLSPQLVGRDGPGVLARTPLPRTELRLAHVLEADGFLFTRHVRAVG